MGAAVSLALASLSTTVRRMSRKLSRSSSREDAAAAAAQAVAAVNIDDATDPAIVLDLDKIGAEPAAATAAAKSPRMSYNGTVGQVLRSKMLISQLIFNVISSVVCSLGLFFLLFAFLDSGPYEWYHPNCIGVIIGSAVFVSPMLVMILAPAGLPEACACFGFFLQELSCTFTFTTPSA